MTDLLRDHYPEIEPYKTGHLDVGQGHQIYWEQCGNPEGIPFVFLDGGPGGAVFPRFRRFFNPDLYHIIQYDQRGCGQSTPFASTTDNTTAHLIEDLEKLRTYLNIEKWSLFGHSWGSTLALAYVTQYPNNVSSAVLGGVFLGRPDEVKNFVQPNGSGAALFPDAYTRFLSPLTQAERCDPFASYIKILHHPKKSDLARMDDCLRQWHTWESVLMKMEYPLSDDAIIQIDEEVSNGFAKSIAVLETHYIRQKCFIDADRILGQLKDLGHIPCLIYQGRVDAVCPAQTAWDVHKAWPNSQST
jgi:proline iminopeptidase